MLETKDDRLLTPEQFFDKQHKKQEKARARKEELDEFNEEERAIEEGREVSINGKPIRRHGSKFQKETPREKTLREIFEEDFAGGGLTFAGAAKFVQHVFEHTSVALSGTFGHKASEKTAQNKYEDDHYIYDTAQVSEPVYHKLIQESEIITAKVRQLEGIKDPSLRDAFEREIETMATEYEMRLHPMTQKYVHDYERVMREEARHAEHCQLSGLKLGAKNHLVCIFQLKHEIGDVRGIKSQVADAYDETPSETKISGQHLSAEVKGPNAPSPS